METVYGVWCKDLKLDKKRGTYRGDWLRELRSNVDDGGIAVLAFTSIREAQARAAKHYGFDTYSEVKAAGWCEVKPLVGSQS